jgi:hypothetical protein
MSNTKYLIVRLTFRWSVAGNGVLDTASSGDLSGYVIYKHPFIEINHHAKDLLDRHKAVVPGDVDVLNT